MSIELIDEWENLRRRPDGAEKLIKNYPTPSNSHLFKTENGEAGACLDSTSLSQLWAGRSKLILDGIEGKALLTSDFKLGLKSQIIKLICDELVIRGLAVNNEHWLTLEDTLLKPNNLSNVNLVVGQADFEKGQSNVSLLDLISTTSLMVEHIEPEIEDWSTTILRRLNNE